MYFPLALLYFFLLDLCFLFCLDICNSSDFGKLEPDDLYFLFSWSVLKMQSISEVPGLQFDTRRKKNYSFQAHAKQREVCVQASSLLRHTTDFDQIKINTPAPYHLFCSARVLENTSIISFKGKLNGMYFRNKLASVIIVTIHNWALGHDVRKAKYKSIRDLRRLQPEWVIVMMEVNEVQDRRGLRDWEGTAQRGIHPLSSG